MSPRHAVFALLPHAVVLVSGPAAAVELSFGAPESVCPNEQRFIEALRARGAELSSAAATARARAIEVSIRRSDGAYVGTLTVHAEDTAPATRTLHDADCAEVVSGLAFTAAIALGGEARSREAHDQLGSEARSTAELAPVTDARAPVRSPATSPEPALPASPAAERRLRGSSFARDTSIEVTAGALELASARSYTLRAGAAVGLIPGQPMPRYELDASLASFLGLPGGESRLFGPLLQVHWAVLGPVTTRHPGGVTLDSWALEAGINSCSAFTYDTAGWVASLCAEFGAGFFFANGTVSGAAPGEFEDSPGYGYGGLGLDVQYNFSSWAHLGARAGGRLQTPMRVEGPDGTRLFESSGLGAYATIGFGLHF